MAEEKTPKAKYAPNIFQLTGLTLEEFKLKAREAPSARALAEELGICINSAQNYMKRYGLSKAPFRPKKSPLDLSTSSDWSKISRWIQTHPGKKLPASNAEIASICEVSQKAVIHWLDRKRRRLARYCEVLGDLRLQNVTLTATRGIRIPARLIREYTLAVNPKTFVVTVTMTLAGDRKLEADLSLTGYYAIFARSFDEKLKE